MDFPGFPCFVIAVYLFFLSCSAFSCSAPFFMYLGGPNQALHRYDRTLDFITSLERKKKERRTLTFARLSR